MGKAQMHCIRPVCPGEQPVLKMSVVGRQSREAVSMDFDCLQEKQFYLPGRSGTKIKEKGVVKEESMT